MTGSAAFDLEAQGESKSLLRYAGSAEVGGVVAGVGSACSQAWPSSSPDGFSRHWKSISSKAGTRQRPRQRPEATRRFAAENNSRAFCCRRAESALIAINGRS